MALKDIPVPTQKVTVRGEEVTLRGLSARDVLTLLLEHREDMDALVAQAQDVGTDEAMANAESMVLGLLRDAPELVAKAIALAADEPDAAEVVARLALPDQLELIMAVGRLTFEEAGGVKKFLENVVVVMRASRTTLSGLKQPA